MILLKVIFIQGNFPSYILDVLDICETAAQACPVSFYTELRAIFIRNRCQDETFSQRYINIVLKLLYIKGANDDKPTKGQTSIQSHIYIDTFFVSNHIFI